MNIRFIMVRTAYPSNIGAAARAIKAMGFTELHLVAPLADLQNPRVKALGKHAEDILERTVVHNHLDQATADCEVVIGTTHRIRHNSLHTLSARSINNFLSSRLEQQNRIAIVFGPESTGLTNTDFEYCDVAVQIPTAHDQPCLNLAQAVMVLAYELNHLPLRQSSKQRKKQRTQVSSQTYQATKAHIARILEQFGIESNSTLQKRILSRLDALSFSDLGLVYKIRDQVRAHLRQSTN